MKTIITIMLILTASNAYAGFFEQKKCEVITVCDGGQCRQVTVCR